MRIYLIRHPEPDIAAGICYGQSDIGLAEEVGLCAARLRPLLNTQLTLFTSPLQRCRKLADALHPMPIEDARLSELHFGTWEMRPWTEIERSSIDAWASAPLNYAPPNGESVAALRERVAQFVDERLNANEQALILVTHSGVMKVCCALLLGLPEAEWLSLHFDYGTVSLIENNGLLWHNRSS